MTPTGYFMRDYEFIRIHSSTHHAFALHADVVLLGFAGRAVDHGDFVPVEKSLATRHAIQFALVRTAGVRDPTAGETKIA